MDDAAAGTIPMNDSTAAAASSQKSMAADPAHQTPKQLSSKFSAPEPTPFIARPHFHFRSSLTATPTSNPTPQLSPFLQDSPATAASASAPASAPPASSAAALAASKLSSAPSLRRAYDDLTLQRRRTRERKSRIQQTFLLLSSCSIVLLCLLLAYYNYLLLAPQLTSLFWAVLFSLLLSRPQQLLIAALDSLHEQLKGKKATIATYAAVGAAVVVAVSRANIVVAVLVAVSLIVLIGVLYGDPQHVVSVCLLGFVVFLIAFPLAFFLKTCVDETQEISHRVQKFVSLNPQFEHLLRNFTSSSYYASLLGYAQRLGVSADTVHSYLDPARLKDRLATLIASLSDQLSVVLSGALSVLAQLGNTLISMVSFLGALYFLLDNRSAWLAGLLSLSPFSEEENARLGNEMRRSVQSIFICSFLIGLLHAVSTYIAFTLVGIDLCLILSFLAGFCAMLPIFSTWLVWMPAIVSLLCLNRPLSASLLLLIQLFLVYYLDPLILTRIRPEQSSLIGMSIVLGIGAFGSTGVVIGPLLTTVTLTLANIYIEYITAPLPQHSHTHHSGRLSSTGGGVGSRDESGSSTGGQQQQQQQQADVQGGDVVRLTSAAGLDKQWTGDSSFPTFFHAVADTPAATLGKPVSLSTLQPTMERAVAGLQRHRTQPSQLPTQLEPPSPLAWQTNPLGSSSGAPSTSPSALPSPMAAQQPPQPQPQPSSHPQVADEKSAAVSPPSSAKQLSVEPAGERFLHSSTPPLVKDRSVGLASSGLDTHIVQQPQTAPLLASALRTNSPTHSALQQQATEAATPVVELDMQHHNGTPPLPAPATAPTSASASSSSSTSSVSARRPAALRPLRLREDDDDPSAVPAAVFIHESDDEGPDSGFNLAADEVDAAQRERKQRVIMLPLSTRARKRLSAE